MSTADLQFAAIDTAIAKGEWWINLFEALSEAGMKQVDALKVTKGTGLVAVARAYCRLAQTVRLAIVAAMRLDHIRGGLADLRRLAPEAIAAAIARARTRAEEAAAARAKARDNARVRREALKSRGSEDPAESSHPGASEREALDPKDATLRDRDSAVEALDRRLTVDPAGVDFDALPLRKTVERICAALGVTPDWSRWEAGDWTMSVRPTRVRAHPQDKTRAIPPADQSRSRAPSEPKPSVSRRLLSSSGAAALPRSPTIPYRPVLTPGGADTAIAAALTAYAGANAPPWPPP